jgi:hypothetical protein
MIRLHKKQLFGNLDNSCFPFIGLDAFIVMPDHIHGIIIINRFIGTPMVGALHATALLKTGI